MSTNNKKIITFGCRANQYQSNVLDSQDFNYIINTCIVTRDAERKSRQAIRRALRENPKAKIIVTGCLVNLHKDKLKAEFPETEILDPPSFAPLKYSKTPRIRMNLMIQDGCEHFCSYCIVPYARGKIKSKPIEQVIEEAKQLVSAGAREIVLTGINLGTYQYDLNPVIRQLSQIKNLLRIRLSSIEPMYLTRNLIDAVAQTQKVCRHLHIPLQSGDNNILKAMNRNYTRDDFLGLVSYIKKNIPDCGITTDVMVGFPGEGEQEFQNTVDLIDQIKFSRLHVFSYSQRAGTPAADFPDQVEAKIKKERNEFIRQLGAKHMLEFAKQHLSREVEILAEKKGEGKTSNFIHCHFDDPHDSSGQLIKKGPPSLKYPCFL